MSVKVKTGARDKVKAKKEGKGSESKTEKSTDSILSNKENLATSISKSANKSKEESLKLAFERKREQNAKMMEQIKKDALQLNADEDFFEKSFMRLSKRSMEYDKKAVKAEHKENVDWGNFEKSGGGLQDSDRELLSKMYKKATSVIEFGIGESTRIAAALGVPRLTGVESDVNWIDATRSKVPGRYQFHLADVGKVGSYGTPIDKDLPKIQFRYQLAPLAMETEPFDVYLVDGRYRVGCAFASILHASVHGGKDATFCMHDYFDRPNYHSVELALVELERSEKLKCFKRNTKVTDAEVYLLWDKHILLFD